MLRSNTLVSAKTLSPCDVHPATNRQKAVRGVISFESKADQTKLKFELLRNGFIGNVFNSIALVCDGCNSCHSLRTNMAKFDLSPSQKRALRRGKDYSFDMVESDKQNHDSLYKLYLSYLRARHSDPSNEMLQWTRERFAAWITDNPLLLLAKHKNVVVGFVTIDNFAKELSYDFSVYDPSHSTASIGKQLWLQAMLIGQTEGFEYAYVGPWAKNSPKLGYKENFRGLETYVDNRWIDFSPELQTAGANNNDKLIALGLAN